MFSRKTHLAVAIAAACSFNQTMAAEQEQLEGLIARLQAALRSVPREHLDRLRSSALALAFAQIPTHEIDELLLLSSWFRKYPDELERADRSWTDGVRVNGVRVSA